MSSPRCCRESKSDGNKLITSGAFSRLSPRSFRATPFSASAIVASLWGIYANSWRITFPTLVSDERTYANAAWLYIHGDNNAPPIRNTLSSADNFEHPPLAKYLYGIAQLFVGRPSVVADRVVAVLCTLATALVLARWLSRIVNGWVGLGAGLMVAVLPMPISDVDFRFGRYGMLDPVAELFMIVSIVLAWTWGQSGGRKAWVSAVVLGGDVGLAAGAKENGFLGAVGPIMIVIVLAVGSRRLFAERVAQAALAVACSGAVFLSLYLPLGHPLGDLRYLLSFQSHQSAVGHVVGFAGRAIEYPPWWTFLWFAGHSLGSVVVVVSLSCAAAALVLRHDVVVLWCVAALAGPLIFHSAIAGVVLPYYWVMWMPAYLALVAIGVGELIRVGCRHRPGVRLVSLAAAGACIAVLVFVSVRDTARMTTRQVTGAAKLPAVMRSANLHGPVITAGMYRWDLAAVTIPGGVTQTFPTSLGGYDTVVVSTPRCNDPIGQGYLALVRINLAAGTLREVYHDKKMTVYGATAPLIRPTSGQIRAEPYESRSQHC